MCRCLGATLFFVIFRRSDDDSYRRSAKSRITARCENAAKIGFVLHSSSYREFHVLDVSRSDQAHLIALDVSIRRNQSYLIKWGQSHLVMFGASTKRNQSHLIAVDASIKRNQSCRIVVDASRQRNPSHLVVFGAQIKGNPTHLLVVDASIYSNPTPLSLKRMSKISCCVSYTHIYRNRGTQAAPVTGAL